MPEINEGACAPFDTSNDAVLLPPGVPPLNIIYVYVSAACNLACRHCWISPTFAPEGAPHMCVSLDHLEKAIVESKPLGLERIKLTGGEPTIHPQFREMLTLISDNEVGIAMETNATLIDDDLARFMKDETTMEFISTSMDGAKKETHETMRVVSGSYEKTLSGIESMVRAGYQPQVILTLSKYNQHEIGDIVSLSQSLGCGSVKFNVLQATGRGGAFGDSHGLTTKETIDAYRYIETEVRPDVEIGIFFDIPVAFHSLRSLAEDKPCRCTLQKIIGLLSSGDLALCGIGVEYPQLTYGNIEVDNMRDVWCHAQGLLDLREQVPAQLEGVCSICLHRDFCQGCCVASNFHGSRKLTAPYALCQNAYDEGLFPAGRLIPGARIGEEDYEEAV